MEKNTRLAAITGSGRGIGRAIAEALAADGVNVAILDLNGDSAGKAAAEISEKHGVSTWSAELDVSQKDAVVQAFQRMNSEFGQADILVNNAAIVSTASTILDMEMDYWDHEIQVNLSGAFYCVKQVLPGMMERKWGRIVTIASIAGRMGGYGQSSYAASKSGLFGLTKTIALEHARHNITANVVLPGLVNTPAVADIPEPVRDRIVKTVPIRRMAEPSEIANVVAFLASEKASYMNGAEVCVTAGCELFTF